MSMPRCLLDRTGFPYLAVPELGFAVALLPVTKAQAEVWLGDPAGPGDEWYSEVLAISPRVGWRADVKSPSWHLFLTGIHPEEAERLAVWLGPEYRLPDAREWRAADRALAGLTQVDLPAVAHPAAAGILRRPRQSAAELTFLEDGILEWVRRPTPPHGALGRPAADLPAKLILDPQTFDPVTLVKPVRHPAFGARLVCTLPSGRSS